MNSKLVLVGSDTKNIDKCLKKAFPVSSPTNKTINQLLEDLKLKAVG